MALSTKPYKGARDFYPEDKRLQKYLFNTWREVVESYGYEEYDAPIIEPLEIYLAKSGSEIVDEQTYNFTDRGKREIAIRPEMTPSVSRLVAAKRQELVYPLRLYSIPNLWRYERPQRGRLREHWQLNVDIFGVQDIQAEYELINLVDDIFKAFKADDTMYEIRINHRSLVDDVLINYLNLDSQQVYAVSKLIDRMHKISKLDFIKQLDLVLSDDHKTRLTNEKLLSFLEARSLEDLPDFLKQQQSFKQLSTLMQTLNKTNVKFDPTIMRGFDYYSGIIFEVVDLNPDNNRSMMGGGRYDGLVGLFGVAPVPTVGFGWGDVTLTNFLEANHLMPKFSPEADVYVALIGDVFFKAQPVLQGLRQAGIKVAVDLSQKKLGEQLKHADKKQLSRVLIIGETEIASAKYKLKDLNSGKEVNFTLQKIIEYLKK